MPPTRPARRPTTAVTEDPIPLTIMEIQGLGHLSNDDGILIETSGMTTAVSGLGYWIQDTTGDANTDDVRRHLRVHRTPAA